MLSFSKHDVDNAILRLAQDDTRLDQDDMWECGTLSAPWMRCAIALGLDGSFLGPLLEGSLVSRSRLHFEQETCLGR